MVVDSLGLTIKNRRTLPTTLVSCDLGGKRARVAFTVTVITKVTDPLFPRSRYWWGRFCANEIIPDENGDGAPDTSIVHNMYTK